MEAQQVAVATAESGMSGWLVALIWIVVIGGVLIGLYFWGRKIQGRFDEQQAMINEHKQATQIFVIDKKKDKLENINLPKMVKEQIPKRQAKRQMPVVIAKIGPQIMTLLCDENIYSILPVKKTCKVELAGVLIVNVLSGKLPQPAKTGFRQKMLVKASKLRTKSVELKDAAAKSDQAAKDAKAQKKAEKLKNKNN
ncbi:hypothetical protein [Candidatus Epulonipiscium viviparus]|uniref:hypothetical protein n=1 Tax=Candidatus Epulonipiscium viviparus TaxID=420336 RepID=UPI00016C0DAB|nr:hypothetical protein [Candidatus Epulopiscium viviparus]